MMLNKALKEFAVTVSEIAINISISWNGEFVEPAGLLIIATDELVTAIVPVCDT